MGELIWKLIFLGVFMNSMHFKVLSFTVYGMLRACVEMELRSREIYGAIES